MKRYCIPAMILVFRETAEEATEFASAAACSINENGRPTAPKLYLCEASPTSELPADFEGEFTLEGLTCDHDKVKVLRELLGELLKAAKQAHEVLDNYITADDSTDAEIAACDGLWALLPKMDDALKVTP